MEQAGPILRPEDQEAIDALGNELEAVCGERADAPAAENGPQEGSQKDPQDMAQEATQTQAMLMAEAFAAAQAQAEEYLAMAQRVQADFDNFRRRNQSVRKEAYDDGARTFATTLLPVLDNLERAIDAAKASPDTALREGVEMVFKQMTEVFAKRDIVPICRLGEKFDPNLENAVLQGSPQDGEPGTVCEVFQKGYQMGETVLRHAMVKVVPE